MLISFSVPKTASSNSSVRSYRRSRPRVIREAFPPALVAAHVEHLAEQIAEDIPQILRIPAALERIPRRRPTALERRMPVAVVRRALLRIAQYAIRLTARI